MEYETPLEVVVGEAEGVAEGLGAGVETPLLQTSFLPLFTQVYFLPAAVIVCPAILQEEPGVGAVAAWAIVPTNRKATTGDRICKAFLMYRQ